MHLLVNELCEYQTARCNDRKNVTSYFKMYADMWSLFFLHIKIPVDRLKEFIYIYMFVCFASVYIMHLHNSFTIKHTIRTTVQCCVFPSLQYAAHFPKAAAYQSESSGSRSQEAV